jgi:hypothetical protein
VHGARCSTRRCRFVDFDYEVVPDGVRQRKIWGPGPTPLLRGRATLEGRLVPTVSTPVVYGVHEAKFALQPA